MKNQKTCLVQPRLKEEVYNKITEMSKKFDVSVKFICQYYIEHGINSKTPIILNDDKQKG